MDIEGYGLVFLLGSLTVASLSDLRRMAAQKDFSEVWAVFTLALFAFDIYQLEHIGVFLLKWSLIIAFIVASTKMEKLWAISLMDVTVICAVLSLLDPLSILIFLGVLIAIKEITNPVLKKFGEGDSYPFLPVVWISAAVMLGFVIAAPIDTAGLTLRALS